MLATLSVRSARRRSEVSGDVRAPVAPVFHPNQVAPVNEIFRPSAAETTRARTVIAAWEAARARGEGVLLAGGEFVAIDIVRMMERVLARADAAAGRAGGR